MKIQQTEPLYINRFITGLYTQRSALVTPFSFLGLQRLDRYDALIDGGDMEISDSLTLRRRPGHSQFCTAQLGASEVPRSFYSWRDENGTIRLVADLTTSVSIFTPSAVTSIHTPSDSTQPWSFQAVTSALYMVNGVEAKKRTSAGVTSNMGIAKPGTAPTIVINNQSSKLPGSAAGTNWTTPTNALTSNDSYAVYNNTAQDDLRLTNFGFSLPTTVTILGIKVDIEGNGSSGTAAQRQIRVGLTKDGTTLAGTRTTGVELPASDGTVTVGGPTSLHGTTWTKAEIESSNFGVLISDNDTTAAALNIDAVTVTVYYSVSNGLTATSGYRYVYVFRNDATGHISTQSPMSANTGAITNAAWIQLSGSDSSDAQVDKIEIYRTKDGGSVFYYLATINEGASWSYTDTTPDSGLNTARIAPLFNDPPPTGAHLLTFHMGRLWAAVGNKAYFSTGPDCLNGVPEEAWNSLSFFSFPGKVTAMVPTKAGLMVFTASDSFIIRGVDAETFYPQLWQSRLGVLSQNAVVLDGETLYIYTASGQLLAISNTIEDIGFAVGVGASLLPGFAPADSYLTMHRNGPQDTALYLCNGAGKVLRYSLSLKAWSPLYTVVGGAKAIASLETSAGAYNLLVGRGAGSGYILKRDTSLHTDDGSNFSAFLTFGSFMLAAPGKTVSVDSILLERTSAGSQPTVAILPNEISGSFTTLTNPVDEPPELPASSSIIAKRYYLKTANIPQIMRHLQVKFSFAAENAKNEVLGLGIRVEARPQ